jgi:hypothetical protein
LRFKLHNWGVEKLTGLIKKDMEIMEKMLKDKKEKMFGEMNKLTDQAT